MPTNTTIPTLATGNVLTAGEWNDLTPLNKTVGLYGVTSLALVGTPPAVTAPNFYIQAGRSSVTLTSGTGTITFPSAFPNGLIVFHAICNNGAGASQIAINSGTAPTLSAVSIVMYTPSGSTATGTHDVQWIAIGF
jgi:hypothetical protein